MSTISEINIYTKHLVSRTSKFLENLSGPVQRNIVFGALAASDYIYALEGSQVELAIEFKAVPGYTLLCSTDQGVMQQIEETLGGGNVKTYIAMLRIARTETSIELRYEHSAVSCAWGVVSIVRDTIPFHVSNDGWVAVSASSRAPVSILTGILRTRRDLSRFDLDSVLLKLA